MKYEEIVSNWGRSFKFQQLLTVQVRKQKNVSHCMMTLIKNFNCSIPRCIICQQCLSNPSVKPSLLKMHQQTKHTDTEINLSIEFFQIKAKNFRKESVCMKGCMHTNTNLQKASYLSRLRIEKSGKPHIIGELFIMPATKDMVNSVLGEKTAKETETFEHETNFSVDYKINSFKRKLNT